jgi:uncharacterized protein
MDKNLLKNHTISRSLFTPVTLPDALIKLSFVQADPIRSPARAQDLILRHRVVDYKNGDLEQKYTNLSLEEHFLYMYGFVVPEIYSLWFPKKNSRLTNYDKQVLGLVASHGKTHSMKLEQELGKKRVSHGWKGFARAAKQSLEKLHEAGLVRVVGRERGFRIYAPSAITQQKKTIPERKRALVLAALRILSPLAEKTLGIATYQIRKHVGETKSTVEKLLKEGALVREKIDRVNYIRIADEELRTQEHEGVKFLSPFDPLVWDRSRFEHLWGWPYRFEAYIPQEKRIRGYYAMPLLFRSDVIGWANITKKEKTLGVELGFVNGKPTGKKFDQGLEEEISRMKQFLGM